jgi:hypothetical protein
MLAIMLRSLVFAWACHSARAACSVLAVQSGGQGRHQLLPGMVKDEGPVPALCRSQAVLLQVNLNQPQSICQDWVVQVLR